MVVRGRGLALAGRVGQRGIEGPVDQGVVAAVDQHLRSLLQLLVIHHSALAELVVVAEEVVVRMVDHKLVQVCDVHGPYGLCGCQGVHNFLRLVEGHMVLLAYHQERHQRVHHFEKRKQKQLGPRISLKVARKECCLHSRWQCEQHQQHQEQRGIVRWIVAGRNPKHSDGHPKLLGSP